MNEAALLKEMTAELQIAQRVVYLEGKTDVPIFFALLGLPRPRADIHQGVLVRGPKDEAQKGIGKLGHDAEARFAHEATAIQEAIRTSIDKGHALVNGKWLVDTFAPRALGGRSNNQPCREEWIAHAVAAGGLTEVRALWHRITGRMP